MFLFFVINNRHGILKRRERDSNPRNPLGVYTLSRRASSTTRASLQGLVETGCKGIDFFDYARVSLANLHRDAMSGCDYLAHPIFIGDRVNSKG